MKMLKYQVAIMIGLIPGGIELQRICGDYQRILMERGMVDETDEDSEDELLGSDEEDENF